MSRAVRPAAAAYLLGARAIRARCGQVLASGLAGRLRHFAVDPGRLPGVAALVAEVTRRRYPDLRIPYHSRWRHLDAGGIARVAALDAALSGRARDEQARARIDLAVISVLLDAGAGRAWRYREASTGRCFSRSEGLAVASFRMFEAGRFSSDASDPWRADAAVLEALDEGALATALQASAGNPLAAVAGRAALLRRLGQTLGQRPDLFGAARPRAGDLLDALRRRARRGGLEARTVLALVLEALGPIWPGRLSLDGINLGDTWPHPAAGGRGRAAGLVPLHKLSQWLAYSLVEPIESAGLTVSGLEALTGLAEYRNGGLLVDLGVLAPRHAGVTGAAHPPGSEVIVEWRALTVGLLDRLAPMVARCLGLSPAELPLARLLEGGTWAAGREVAEARRGGEPPIRVESDGTVL